MLDSCTIVYNQETLQESTIRMDESRNLADLRMKFQNSPPLLFCDGLKCEWVGEG